MVERYLRIWLIQTFILKEYYGIIFVECSIWLKSPVLVSVMGHVISCGLDLILSGKGIHTDQELKSSMLSLEGLAARSNITKRERLHVKAVKEWAEGWVLPRCHVNHWDQILTLIKYLSVLLRRAYQNGWLITFLMTVKWNHIRELRVKNWALIKQ